LVSLEQINQTLGYSLSSAEFNQYLPQLKHKNPKVGKFWQGNDTEPGIYIVIAGKARLLDEAGELIATLEAGESFGEFTLFPQSDFQTYGARASVNLQLCFIPSTVLLPLMATYPQIKTHLWQQAQQLNSRFVNSTPTPEVVENINSQPQFSYSPKSEPKISKAYFPSPTQRVRHLWQHVIRRYPFFAQQSASDCGAACLVMVSRYWGKRFSVNRLRDIANVDRNGASLRGLLTAAESLGFATRPVKASLNQLAKQKLPANRSLGR
jgi:subfamily B ATP-binding cassette protein HlyB/CyaB